MPCAFRDNAVCLQCIAFADSRWIWRFDKKKSSELPWSKQSWFSKFQMCSVRNNFIAISILTWLVLWRKICRSQPYQTSLASLTSSECSLGIMQRWRSESDHQEQQRAENRSVQKNCFAECALKTVPKNCQASENRRKVFVSIFLAWRKEESQTSVMNYDYFTFCAQINASYMYYCL